MEITSHGILITKTARYYTAGKIDSATRELWFVLHGYAQLAGDFIKEFGYLAAGNSAVAAPEGLSRFYSRNNPAASWMTKEDRDNEILDYVKYLDMTAEEISTHLSSECTFNLLGFSQGVHTAIRWFCKGKPEFEKLLICSSDIPGDIDYAAFIKRSHNSAVYYICGNADEFVKPAEFEAGKKALSSGGVDFEAVDFNGNHRVYHEFVKSLTPAV